jgi:hypothetical protein
LLGRRLAERNHVALPFGLVFLMGSRVTLGKGSARLGFFG